MIHACILINVLQDGATPLYRAAFYGHNDTVDILVEAGAKVDTIDQVSWKTLIFVISEPCGHMV